MKSGNCFIMVVTPALDKVNDESIVSVAEYSKFKCRNANII